MRSIAVQRVPVFSIFISWLVLLPERHLFPVAGKQNRSECGTGGLASKPLAARGWWPYGIPDLFVVVEQELPKVNKAFGAIAFANKRYADWPIESGEG
jgi:hypothetical protein